MEDADGLRNGLEADARSPREVQINLWVKDSVRRHLNLLASRHKKSISTIAVDLMRRGYPSLEAEWEERNERLVQEWDAEGNEREGWDGNP